MLFLSLVLFIALKLGYACQMSSWFNLESKLWKFRDLRKVSWAMIFSRANRTPKKRDSKLTHVVVTLASRWVCGGIHLCHSQTTLVSLQTALIYISRRSHIKPINSFSHSRLLGSIVFSRLCFPSQKISWSDSQMQPKWTKPSCGWFSLSILLTY